MVLVHRDELARQAADKIMSVVQGIKVGIVKAERNDVDTQVIVASVQTLVRPERLAQVRDVGLVVVDEAHHYVATSFLSVLEQLGVFETVKCVGYTATMARSDSVGLGDLWQEVVFERDILWGIVSGFLVDVEAQSVTVDDLNLAEIARSRGDYQEGKLGDALIASGAAEITAKAYLEQAGERQGVLFAPTVASARDFEAAFNRIGIVTESIFGETPVEERQRIFERYQRCEIQILSSVMTLTEGWDMPQAEVAVMARPTQSPPLRIQCIGRVLRPHPTKRKPALVLDVVGAVSGGALTGLSDLSRTDAVPEVGETLYEALERSEAEAGNVERDVITGKVTRSVVKLFEASPAVWVQTRKGTWCIPTRKGYVVLMPVDEGQFRVAKTHSQWSARGDDAKWLTERPMSMDIAMSWSEQLAMELDPLVADKSRDWRANRRKATQKQKDLATRLKITYPDNVRKGDLARMIDEHQASRMLD